MPRTVLITIEGLLEMMINRDKLKLIDVLSAIWRLLPRNTLKKATL